MMVRGDFGVSKIIVHSGQAHADDFLATALLVHMFGVPVYRVNEVTKEDLENHSVVVVDIGGKYEPNKNNFDHHHDRNLPCSLILVLQKFFPEIPTDMDELRWISDWDTKGVFATQKAWNVKLPEFRDPIAEMMLRVFSESEAIFPETHIHEILKAIGKEFLNYLKEQAEFIEKAKNAEVFEVKGLKVVQLNENIPIRFIKSVHPNVAVVIQPNQRTAGAVTLTRVDDHPRVDFNRIRNKVPAHFIHANGFMAAIDPENVQEALEIAIM